MPRMERIVGLPLLAVLSGCADELVTPYEIECDDDAIGWELEIEGLLPVPRPEYEVTCGTGWGHGVATKEPSSTTALPDGYEWIGRHPDGGFLLRPYGRVEGWSEHFGVEIADGSLHWVDEGFEQILWSHDDFVYRPPAVVGSELWVLGDSTLLRIDAKTGDLLEQVPWTLGTAHDWEPAWPSEGGIWYVVREDYDDDSMRFALSRMPSFGATELVREREVALVDGGHVVSGLHPTPGGGAIWGYWGELESVADDGNVRWTLTEPHCWLTVDDRGGFLLGCTSDEDPDDQRFGLGIQRRAQVDGSLLWSRVHQRFDFATSPPASAQLSSFTFHQAARPGGGYIIAGGHALPSASCPQQPLTMAISEDGEVEWAYRVETCGFAYVLDPIMNGSVFVHGASFTNGDGSNGNVAVDWVQRFEL